MYRILGYMYFVFIASVNCNFKEEQDILRKILDPITYDKRIRAHGISDTDSKVWVNLFVHSIDSVDDLKMARKESIEKRVFHANNIPYVVVRFPAIFFWYGYDNGSVFFITLNDFSDIWIPDLFFPNEKEAWRHDLIGPNSYALIWPDGQVQSSQRLSLKLSCPMILKKFPFDIQTCSFKISSYGRNTGDIVIKWKHDEPVKITRNLHIQKFNLRSFTTNYCDTRTNTDEYSCLQLSFQFKRQLTFYLIQFFIPSMVLVLTAWLSFWITPRKVVARIMLTLTCLLGLIIQTSLLNLNLPKLPYIKASDVWIGMCFIFIFSSLLEFIVIHYILQWETNSKVKVQDPAWSIRQKLIESVTVSSVIDILARLLYPILFLCCNIAYFRAYVEDFGIELSSIEFP